MTHLAAAGGALGRELSFVLLEVALRVPAGEAEGDPIAEGLPALLTEPVGRLAHGVLAYAVG